MANRMRSSRLYRRCMCLVVAIAMANAPSASLWAQTNAAQQAVRQRVERYGPYEYVPTESREGVPPSEYGPPSTDPNAARWETSFVSPSASAVLVIRPSQILNSPNSELLPKEVATAAGMQHLGFDPAEVEEIVAYVEMPNPLALSYAVTIRFINPFRAVSIPVERRAHAQLAELGGKKYLKSALPPPMYSLYGPNNRTLVIAPDPALQQLVQSIGQPKSGPMVDRLQNAPAGSDLYFAIDGTILNTLVQTAATQAPTDVPAEVKPLLDLPKLVQAVELTLNVSNDGPISLVVHATDEAAAQQLELIMQQTQAQSQLSPGDSPIQQAMAQYAQRVTQPFTPRRNGTSVTCLYVDNQTPAHKQMITSLVNAMFAFGIPAAQAASQMQPMGGEMQFEQFEPMPPSESGEAPPPAQGPENH
jgi:hypothetical protein